MKVPGEQREGREPIRMTRDYVCVSCTIPAETDRGAVFFDDYISKEGSQVPEKDSWVVKLARGWEKMRHLTGTEREIINCKFPKVNALQKKGDQMPIVRKKLV